MTFKSYYRLKYELVEAAELEKEQTVDIGNKKFTFQPEDMYIRDQNNNEFILERSKFDKQFVEIVDAEIIQNREIILLPKEQSIE